MVLYLHWQQSKTHPWASYCYGAMLRTGRYPSSLFR